MLGLNFIITFIVHNCASYKETPLVLYYGVKNVVFVYINFYFTSFGLHSTVAQKCKMQWQSTKHNGKSQMLQKKTTKNLTAKPKLQRKHKTLHGYQSIQSPKNTSILVFGKV